MCNLVVRGSGSAVSPENNKQRRVTWLLSCVECAVDRSKDAACSLFVMIHVKRLTKAASIVAIAIWLRSPLTEVAIQFDNLTKGMVKGIGSRIVVLFVYWICLISLPSVFGFASTREKRCGERNVLIEEECGRQR